MSLKGIDTLKYIVINLPCMKKYTILASKIKIYEKEQNFFVSLLNKRIDKRNSNKLGKNLTSYGLDGKMLKERCLTFPSLLKTFLIHDLKTNISQIASDNDSLEELDLFLKELSEYVTNIYIKLESLKESKWIPNIQDTKDLNIRLIEELQLFIKYIKIQRDFEKLEMKLNFSPM